MDIGSLTEYITLQHAYLNQQDSKGQQSTVYHDYAKVWANIRSLSVTNFMAAKVSGSKITHTVLIRYRTDVKIGDRILWGSRILEVEKPLPEGKDGTIITAVELVQDALPTLDNGSSGST